MEGIIAVNKLGAIGLNGGLPWSCLDDLKHFRKLTMSKHLIVGRKTAEKLPKLKGRTIHIVTKENPLEQILKLGHDFMVIGGANIYSQLLDKCSIIHVSLINDLTDGDTYYELTTKQKEKAIYYEFNL
jgi:dihydrofolate reductase